jgi:hypothetical protein
VQDGLREPDPLPVALGQLPAMTVRHVIDPRALHRCLDPLFAFARRQPLGLDARDKLQILAHRHFGVERRRFRKVSGPALGLDGLVEDVEAGDHRLASRRRHVAGEDAHGRRLAGAVRAQKAEDFSTLDPEGEVIDRRDAAISLGEVLNLYQLAFSMNKSM